MTRPRGRPPMPSATSRAIDPVGITSIGARVSSPSRMTAPLPCCRSICASAVVSALSRSKPAMDAPLDRSDGRRRRYGRGRTVSVPRHRLWTPARKPQYEHLFDIVGRHAGRPPDSSERGWAPAKPPGERGWGPATSGEAAENSVPLGDRDLEVLADGPPDVPCRLALGECLVDGAISEPADDLVTGHGVGVTSAEARLHPCPDPGQPHGIPGYPATGAGSGPRDERRS